MGSRSKSSRLFDVFYAILPLSGYSQTGEANRAGSGTWPLSWQNVKRVPESVLLRRKTREIHHFSSLLDPFLVLFREVEPSGLWRPGSGTSM